MRTIVAADTKIMTVSYGTFSCTLEGFDDPFETMKAMVEYFRELTANDRQFGAEPSPLDTEHLQHIAEQTTTHAVEAELSSGQNLLLRKPVETEQDAQNKDPSDAIDGAVTTPLGLSGVKGTIPPEDDVAGPANMSEKLSRVRDAVSERSHAQHSEMQDAARDERSNDDQHNDDRSG